MPSAWRIVKTRYVATAFDGEAAALLGGRWNSRGTRVVYASATLSLALVEILVHLPAGVLGGFSAIPVEFDDRLVVELASARVPAGFQDDPPRVETMAVGGAWVRDARSAVLSVPSAVVLMERNYLLNPRHADFARVKIGRARGFPLDRRLTWG